MFESPASFSALNKSVQMSDLLEYVEYFSTLVYNSAISA